MNEEKVMWYIDTITKKIYKGALSYHKNIGEGNEVKTTIYES